MREFRDDCGRPWALAFTVNSAMRVRDTVTIDVDGQKVPFDIINVGNIGVTLQVLRSQYATIAETLYAILCRQVEEKKISRDEFLDGLRGDALDAAAKALEQELIDFFPQRHRKPISLIAARIDEMQQLAAERAVASIQAVSAEQILAESGMQSGKPPESSESTQESGHSDNSLQPEMAA